MSKQAGGGACQALPPAVNGNGEKDLSLSLLKLLRRASNMGAA